MIGAKPIAAYIELLSLLRRNSSRMSNVLRQLENAVQV